MCEKCHGLNIGININEKHSHCNKCQCPNVWDHKLDNPLPNSDKVGWWKEVLTGDIHWNRCEDFKKKCLEIKNFNKDGTHATEKLPQQFTQKSQNISVAETTNTYPKKTEDVWDTTISLLRDILSTLQRMESKEK